MSSTVSQPQSEKQLTLFDPIEIPLTKGYVALVDPVDADLLQYKWQASIEPNLVYAVRHSSVSEHSRHIRMHRTILERMIGRSLNPGEITDHIDSNGLNNCRNNLRLATSSQNQFNQRTKKRNKSGYKGVHWRKDTNKWDVQLRVNGKRLCLGSFSDLQEAYAAYCEAAKKYHGEFARFK